MSETTNVGSKNYEIVGFFPVVGENGKLILKESNTNARCGSPKSRIGENVIIPVYNGGKPKGNPKGNPKGKTSSGEREA